MGFQDLFCEGDKLMMRDIRALAISIINKYPPVRVLVNHIRFVSWKLRLKIRTNVDSKYLDPYKVYWIDPRRIRYCVLRKYHKLADRGKIIGGNWDKQKIEFTSLDVFRASRDRFLYGEAWKETEFYHRVLREIRDGETKWGCRSKMEFDERCKYLDSLFQDIKNNGYKSQAEMDAKDNPLRVYDEISVCIDRNGNFLFEDGRHRLATAKLLNVNRIPVQITIRHLKWYEFRQEILDYARKKGGKIYHPLTHPDLSDIPAVHSNKRFEIIKQNLPLKRSEILDIGAHWGYFCHKFEEEGFDCYAIENDPAHVYFLRKLKKAENRNFKIIDKSIFEYKDKTKFDLVLALNIFHHFLKEKKSYYQLVELLKRLDMNIMFFEPHLPEEPQMRKAYINYNCKEFIRFILKNSCLTKAEFVGEAENRRPIYKLYR